jgi:hypothetical protein
MEPEGSLPCSQEPAASPYTPPDQSTPTYAISLRFVLVISSQLRLVLPSNIFRSGFPTRTL